MGQVIGDILPLALGIALSPVPIIAVILVLLSPNARTIGLAFLVGTVVGVILVATVFALLATLIPESDPDASRPIAGTVKIVLGALLAFLAYRQWRARPRDGEDTALPKWMSAMDTLTRVKAFGLAFVLAAVNPKNLLLAGSAGVTIGTGGLDVGQAAFAVIVFTVIATASIWIAVTAELVAANRMAGPLESLRVWLVRHNAAVMSVLLLVIGVVMIGKGIGDF